MKKPPAGFECIADDLDVFESAMREAMTANPTRQRQAETTWEIAKINRKRSRYVYTMWKVRGVISQEVVQYCGKYGMCDLNLIELWQLPGYENVCNAQCVMNGCVCRVPKRDRAAEHVQCSICGCSGCAAGDRSDDKQTKKKRNRNEEKDDLSQPLRENTQYSAPEAEGKKEHNIEGHGVTLKEVPEEK